ncbi:CHFR [Mytilus edulis]|uniref:CHFR n=1 Tax=Mytilus edulis TaxID=6550 RepID=A0A8S3V3Z3_MYTED|nr:CHFR [Mytilus edulis]
MDECPSPVKCAPPPMKRDRMSISWQRCIICQNITQETLSMTTNRGFTTLINAVRQRQDHVCMLFLSEVDTLEALHVLSQITSAMRARACLVQVDDQCHDGAKTAAKKGDEKHVQDLIIYTTKNMTNPLDADNQPRQLLLNISTDLHESHDIKDSL